MLATTNIVDRRPRLRLTSVVFFVLLSLMIVMLAMALAGSDRSAQAQVPITGGRALAPNGHGPRSATPLTAGRIAFWNGTSGIYTMNADGSNRSLLVSGNMPTWSPDSSQIAFASYAAPTYNIDVINIDGSNRHTIGTGEYPSWSPDGTTIAFSRPDSNGISEIYVMNSDGSNVRQLTTDATGSVNPNWSPDSSKIVFGNIRRDGDDETEIYVMNADGSNPHMIYDPPADNSNTGYPAWSPDGHKIAFRHLLKVYKMNADGTGVTQVSNGQGFVGLSSLAWSPDNLRIAFSYSDGYGQPYQIHVINADGTNDQNISNNADSEANPSWEHIASTTVQVQNEQGTPIPGAQVYRNPGGPGHPSTLVGTTDMSGTVSLPNPAQNEYLIARTLVFTGTTTRGSHDGWAYHVWLTNVGQHANDQMEDAYVITNTTQLTQTVTISHTNPLIGFNIVASVEYNATPDNLDQIVTGFAGKMGPSGFQINPGANDFLLDVADGQMYFEKVTVYEGKQHWNDADYQFFANYPRADSAIRGVTGTTGHIHAQGSDDYGIPWNQTPAYSTLVHEFGHYAVGAYDEYFYLRDGDNASCTLNPDPDYDLRASIMDDARVLSEFCMQDNHNPQTHQGLLNGESVWQTLKRNWDDTQSPPRWTLQNPFDRGFVVPGPSLYISPEMYQPQSSVVPLPASSCLPIEVWVLMGITDIEGAHISQEHNGTVINEGVTDVHGHAIVEGAAIGDTITAVYPGIFTTYTASATVTACTSLITMDLAQAARTEQQVSQEPTYWLTATTSFSQHQVHALLHFTAAPPTQPSLYASQAGINRQQITLTYDPNAHNYTGDYPFDPSLSTDFQFDVGLPGTQGTDLFPYKFNAAQYHTSGPGEGEWVDKDHRQQQEAPTAPSNWDLFGPETMVNLSVDANSLPDGTGVMAGEVNPPAAPPSTPNGLLAVGGPYSVQGEHPISGSVELSLEFQSEYFCGLQPGIKIYLYNGTGWDPMTTSVNEEWHVAAAPITQWGIYAVFAQPNSQVVFSDVPAGSTFYDYINWITCHGIASGYSDGTFRPNNNATRGQISKMVANAYQWHLDPPENGGYTFADVLPGSTFYLYIEAAYREGVVSGYPCGGVGEPCDPQHRPYFRPNNKVTRGQLSKIISNGSKWDDTPTGQTFEDVPPNSTFYTYIERMAGRSIINGYPCRGSGEPCNPPANRPYFRPGNNASRGQLSKMIYLALQPR